MQGPGNGAADSSAGFVLTGGDSKRMGQDKARLPLGGSVLVANIAKSVAAAAGSVTLVGNPKRYSDLEIPAIADLYPGFGPVGGVVTALANSSAEWNVIVACDMPRVSEELLVKLLDAAKSTETQCVVPVTPDGRWHPLCAVYRRSATEQLQKAVDNGVHRLLTAIEVLTVHIFPVSALDALLNVNTPDEWKSFQNATY